MNALPIFYAYILLPSDLKIGLGVPKAFRKL